MLTKTFLLVKWQSDQSSHLKQKIQFPIFDQQDYEAETLEANCLDMLSLVALKLFLGVEMDLIKVWYHVIIGPTTFMK